MGADELTATVVGGGIAGLASAVALAQAGWRVTVLERAAAFGEVGAGLATTGNGMTALAALGLAEAIAPGRLSDRYRRHAGSGRPVDHADARHPVRPDGGHHDLGTSTAAAARRPARGGRGGRRRRAGDGGRGACPSSRAGRAATGRWSPGERQHAGHRAEAALLVAADGVRSAVRAQLFPAAPARYSGSTSWRAVIPDTGSEDRLVQAWGPGAEFGSLRVSPAEIYWYGYFRIPEGAVFADELAAARERFAVWAPWIRAMVAATPAERLMRHDVYHLPGGLPAYANGRVVFVGDAAHAMLPTAGQGAATALEDGVCVGRHDRGAGRGRRRPGGGAGRVRRCSPAALPADREDRDPDRPVRLRSGRRLAAAGPQRDLPPPAGRAAGQGGPVDRALDGSLVSPADGAMGG